MPTEQESKIKRPGYKDMRDPLQLLMTQPPVLPYEGLAKVTAAMSKYSFTGIETPLEAKRYASTGAFLDPKPYADALMNLSEKYSRHYKTEKSWERKDSLKTTHQMITEQALCVMGMNNFPKTDELIYESSGPDTDPETIKFVMEGHFCGRISGGKLGNFLEKYMPHLIFDLLYNFGDLKDHLKETALSNIERYSSKFTDKKEDVKYLAWTLHFLQDITAPHHAGNIPAIIPSFLTDVNQGSDTHSPFEEFANELLINEPNKFNEEAGRLLQELRGFPMDISRPKELKNFGKMILQKSFVIIRSPLKNSNIKNVKIALQTEDHDAWKEVISMAMPLAIASTAAVLEKIKNVNA